VEQEPRFGGGQREDRGPWFLDQVYSMGCAVSTSRDEKICGKIFGGFIGQRFWGRGGVVLGGWSADLGMKIPGIESVKPT
jgi:hypothetical protein